MHPTLLTALVDDRLATLRRDAELARAGRRPLELPRTLRRWTWRRHQIVVPAEPRPAPLLWASSESDCVDYGSDAA